MKKLLPLFATFAILSACQTRGPAVHIVKPNNHAVAVSSLQRINAKAHECWKADKAFDAYGIIPELDTTGTPRILLIPKGKPQALPKLVITANGKSVQTFGPLAQSVLAPRIQSDVTRWASGGTSCSA